MTTKDIKARTYTFTWNNYPDQLQVQSVIRSIENKVGIQYLIYGEETGKAGTPHLQGYITLKKPTRFNTLRTLFEGRVHLEIARGTHKHNVKYCSKTDPAPFIIDNRKKQGQRTDLDEIAQLVVDGNNLYQIATAKPGQFIRYHSGIQRLIEVLKPPAPRSEAPKVLWLYGEPGTGKTYAVYKFARKRNYTVYKVSDHKNMYTYDQQDIILLDDLRSDKFPWDFVLDLLQGYPMQTNAKYKGVVEINSPYIFITCPYNWDNIYTTTENQWQLGRRITKIYQFKKDAPRIVTTPVLPQDGFQEEAPVIIPPQASYASLYP